MQILPVKSIDAAVSGDPLSFRILAANDAKIEVNIFAIEECHSFMHLSPGMKQSRGRILVIAGSDCSGGAYVQPWPH